MAKSDDGLYIMLLSVHGLVRGEDLELGRDSDTGGQIQYVLELMRALAEHPQVARVDLLTRQIFDPKVASVYSEPREAIGPDAFIIRLPCGPKRYLRKEKLWPYLDSFADQALKHIRRVGRIPDVIHSHYADAGYVGTRLASLLEVPLIHTGHSLGHVKRQRLLDQGMKPENIEAQYHISRRIEAEDTLLDFATMVIASTQQEVDEQYSLYDNYQPSRMVVIPPGIDLRRFYPPKRGLFRPKIFQEIARFLRNPGKPIVLALARPDPRKNLSALVKAFGENEQLRELANLVLIAGNRDDVGSMEKGSRRVLTELMNLIDYYDLYGSIAYPKHHDPEDVPHLYRIAAKSKGLFINPALTEPFGLTLLEAAASGLPIIATNDGGPRDIIKYCRNGVLIDPFDISRMGKVLVKGLTNRKLWARWSKSGINGSRRYFTWEGHVNTYLKEIGKILKKGHRHSKVTTSYKSRLPVSDRILVCDIDNTLIGDKEALRQLLERLERAERHIGFGVATGRHIDSAKKVLQDWRTPMPDFFITSVGTEIYYGPKLVLDDGWWRHIDYRWEPKQVKAALKEISGLRLQPREDQREYKISYYIDPKKAPPIKAIMRHLRKLELHANVVYSHQAYLDLLPVRASKGAALRYFADKWGIPVEHILAAGDSGNDFEMLAGETLGVVVGNHSEELTNLHGGAHIYFASGHYAWGILEGMDYYDFFGDIKDPQRY